MGFVALAGLAALAATPAAANPLDDCFDRIAVAVGHPIAHHHPAHRVVRVHKAHHVGPRRPHPHRLAAVRHHPAAPVHHVRYILKPRACGSHPGTMMSAAPGAAPPETPAALIADLAGPPAALPATDVVAVSPAAPLQSPAPGEFVPVGVPGAALPLGGQFIGGTVVPSAPVSAPATPPVSPPGTVTPPAAPPAVTPPVGAVITPPGVAAPPTVTPVVDVLPPVAPPGSPGVTLPPTIVPAPPSGPGLPVTPRAVPEPGVWAMLLSGFFGIGLALRNRRRHPRPACRPA